MTNEPIVGEFRNTGNATEVYVGLGKWVNALAEMSTLRADAKRWKDIAIHLLDCHAATAWEEGMRNKTSNSKRKRFISILESGISFMKGLTKPYMGPGYAEKTPEERVIERCQNAVRDLTAMNQS